jgi:ferric-dicitrate binding protein FerR (iron transport regulator)
MHMRPHRLIRPQLFLLGIVLALAMLAAAPDAAHAQAAAGSITAATGTVQIVRAGATLPAAIGTAVDLGDRVVTAAGGHVAIRLTDGSTLELGESSALVIDQQVAAPAQTRVSLFAGVVRSFVNRTVGAAAPNFEVHTPNAVAAARGTRFDTAYVSGAQRPSFGDCRSFTDVSVYDGVVHLANVNNLAGGVDVPAGYEATVPCMSNPTGAGPLGMTGAASLNAAGGGLGGGNAITPIAPVPPPSCPVCTGGSVGPPPPPPPY